MQKFATLGSVLTAIGALLFTGLTYSAGREQDQRNYDGALVNRFSTAVGQLGGSTVEERLGGIYALKRLAADSPRDRRTIYEVLAGFVRSRGSLAAHGGADACRRRSQPDPDVQTALDALASRAESGAGGLREVDLHGSCLAGARFESADFSHADLSGSVLRGAKITGKVELKYRGGGLGSILYLDTPSDFSDSNMTDVDLSQTQFMGAVFRDAQLAGADFRDIRSANVGNGLIYVSTTSKVFEQDSEGRIVLAGASYPLQLALYLDRAYLVGANFSKTDMRDTSFRGAILTNANFTDSVIEDAWFEGVSLPYGQSGGGELTDKQVRESIKEDPILQSSAG